MSRADINTGRFTILVRRLRMASLALELGDTTYPNGMRSQLGSLRTVQAATPYRTACLDWGACLFRCLGPVRQR